VRHPVQFLSSLRFLPAISKKFFWRMLTEGLATGRWGLRLC